MTSVVSEKAREIREWQLGSGPPPKGFAVRCTGCSRCKVEGHVPFTK